MGFTEVLTIVFIVLKIVGTIDWAWWLVILPEIIAVALRVVLWVISAVIISRRRKKFRKLHDSTFKYF